MSGTSLDSIDVALCRFVKEEFSLIKFLAYPLSEQIRTEVESVSLSRKVDLEILGTLDIKLGAIFSEAVLEILKNTNIKFSDIAAVCSHGQTIRHNPKPSKMELSFSLQIGDPNTIAEKTGITTIADFRGRDIAAGGQGAPLVPTFHQAVFSCAGTRRAIVNIGGFANVTLLDGKRLAAGFDTGPGNTLLDQWAQRHLGYPFDHCGDWAKNGKVNKNLLDTFLSDKYFTKTGPKSTGKELFNLNWLDTKLVGSHKNISAQDVQACLSELTAVSISHAISEFNTDEVFICGGGVHNRDLVLRLAHCLRPIKVNSVEKLGFNPDHIEAAAFAWLGYRALNGLKNNSPTATGAEGERILGGIYQS